MQSQYQNELTLEEMEKKKAELLAKGYQQVSEQQHLSAKQYKIASYTEEIHSFNEEPRYRIEWQD